MCIYKKMHPYAVTMVTAQIAASFIGWKISVGSLFKLQLVFSA